jgi:23S rRNA pseudouridine2605 synthase
MRLNKFIADNTELSRRKADSAIENGRVKINGAVAKLGVIIETGDEIQIDGKLIKPTVTKTTTILLNKPMGYVCSKNGQGSKTIYELLPEKFHHLNIAGRLDKDSSGLVILTDDGLLLNELTHPSSGKEKVYSVTINEAISPAHRNLLLSGVDIGDERPSKFKHLKKISETTYEVVLEEGRNRQIRRAFEALGYKVVKLHRERLGKFKLEKLKSKDFLVIQ